MAAKVALITAGSAGLGAEVARVFARSNIRVVVNYANNTQRAQDLIKELDTLSSSNKDASNPRHHAIQADCGDKPSVQRLVSETVSTMGRLDIVISNHGWTRMAKFLDLETGINDDDWDKAFTFNVKSHLWLAHAARPELDKNEGAFVSTASIAGVRGYGSALAYAVTKSALIHLTKCLAQICAPNVRFNSISPGLLLTEWGMKFPQERRDHVAQSSKLKRLPELEDVAEQVKAMALNRSMTGQNIIVDAGIMI